MEGDAGSAGPFARRLRSLREAASLTQEELAHRAGLTSNAIGALERGERRRPYPHTVRALADALGLDDAGRAALAAAARPGPDPPPEPGEAAAMSAPAVPSTQLFGRDAELAELDARLRSGDVRLLTLTGPGGVGKTRLALAATERLAPGFPDGIAMAELAPVTDPDLLLPTIARTLGLPQVGRRDVIGQVATHLVSRRPLLVLDNVEHLLPAAGDLAELVSRCPGLTILATSRSPLRIRAEHVLPVSPLALPAAPDPTSVLSSAAGQMFLDRARAIAPDYSITREAAPAIAAICRRLDGVPLALELAASHARLLAPETLLDRLDQALSVSRSRELPPRQRTMGATLDWSHSLLTQPEQVLLRRLSVFADGFTLAGAESVLDRVPGSGVDVFAALGGLVEQSLVVVPDRDGRYRLLEPVRQYAALRLADADEAATMSAALADHVAELGHRARAGLWGGDQREWLDRLSAEHADLRTAVTWSLGHSEPGRAARLLADTWLYWALRGHAAEALAALDQVLARGAEQLGSGDRAAAFVALAGLRYATGDVPGTRDAAAEAVDRATPIDAPALRSEALVLAASGAAFAGDLAAAAARLDEAARLDAGSESWVVVHLRLLQGQIEVIAGDMEAARATLRDAEGLARRFAGPFTLATVLNVQASLATLAGEDADALVKLVEAAEVAAEAGIFWTQVYTLPGLADLAVRRGEPELAARLYSAAATLAAGTGLAVSFPPDVERGALGLAQARAELDPRAFQRLWESGRMLRPDRLASLVGRLSVRDED